MRFPYDPTKAAQAAAYLVQLHGGKIQMITLLKLLYLADRTALIEIGRPITGDRMVNMDKGGVLSGVYNSLKPEESVADDPIAEYLRPVESHGFSLVNEAFQTDKLSEYEREILTKIHEKFGSMSIGALIRFMHDLPEYQDPKGSSSRVDLTEILRSANKSDEEIERIGAMAEEYRFISTLG